jgi:hypothetical protein
MALFIAVHLWFTRKEWRRELAVIGLATGVGLAADTIAAFTGAVVFEGGMRVGLVPLWMVSLWAGFGATLLHSQRRMLQGLGLAIAIGALGGPLAYLGGQRLGVLTVAEGYGVYVIGLTWAVALGVLAACLPVFEADEEGVLPTRAAEAV